MTELDHELFVKVRKTVANLKPGHPWVLMDNMDLLRSAGMYLKDQNTGLQGIALAGILNFGSERTTGATHQKRKSLWKICGASAVEGTTSIEGGSKSVAAKFSF